MQHPAAAGRGRSGQWGVMGRSVAGVATPAWPGARVVLRAGGGCRKIAQEVSYGRGIDVKEALRSAIQDRIVPEFDKLRLENAEIRTTLQLTNKRLDAIQQQLIDQSRRIDETNKRIDRVHDDLLTRIDETNKRIDETNKRLDRLYEGIVRREEHTALEGRLARLEALVNDLRQRLAA